MPHRTEVLALFDALPSARVLSHAEVLHFVDQHHLAGSGLGWIDMHLLASAMASRANLATRDRHLAQAARALGLATS
jgi:predicted nucleic acid-binding protein